MSLPKFIYVYEDRGSDGKSYFVATTDPGENSEGQIGVYDLREVLNVRHKLQFRRSKTKTWFDASR